LRGAGGCAASVARAIRGDGLVQDTRQVI
jgi:hypothetical protein